MAQLHTATTPQHRNPKRYLPGFTIVELLIVIVVIAILAAISIVAYTGIQNRAHDASVQSDVRSSYNKMLEYQAVNGVFPNTEAQLSEASLVATRSSYPTAGNVYLLCISNDAAAVVGRSKSGSWFYNGTRGSGSFELSSTTPGNAQVCGSSDIRWGEGGRAVIRR